MCTVTFIPTATGMYLTSNRDERPGRLPARFPFRAAAESGQLLFPRDGEAGGSWIALKDGEDAAVLLNGAFAKHSRESTYRRSRGLVFLEIACVADSVSAFRMLKLEGIEPFTLILVIGGQIFECRWDGANRYITRLPADSPHIWCSATLYDEEATQWRQRRFAEWLGATACVDPDSILDFHRSVRLGEPESGPGIDQQEGIATVSITSIRMDGARTNMRYIDLQTMQQMEEDGKRVGKAPSVNTAGKSNAGLWGRGVESLRRFFIRLMAWEYWPFMIVYLPVFFYWAWLSWKAKSFFFFSTANPSIANAGFLMESKRQIYDLMPDGSYPKTVFCSQGQPVVSICPSMKAQGLEFPLIAKPDIGKRGRQVQLLRNEGELYVYAARSKVDFLLQEYIAYPHEVGIFYYRLPGEPKGHISGIVGKEMLTIKGDGRSTVEALLLKKDRYVLQLPALRAAYGNLLQQTPAAGEERLLVPYGNHSRGAQFLDWSDKCTPMLEETIDKLCRRIPGFYFGRLDIRFAGWGELCEGRNFSVIELNGAGSEPTHMYDPRHSIFFAWKEIIRHLRLLYEISRVNTGKKGIAPMSMAEGWKMLRDDARHEKLLL